MTKKTFKRIIRPATDEDRKRHAEIREKVMQEFPPLLGAKPRRSPSGITVMNAEYVDGYRIRLRFSNGETGVVDLKDSLWGPMFEPLRDTSALRRFAVSEVLHTLSWENGADLAPEFLYDKMIEQAQAADVAGPGR